MTKYEWETELKKNISRLPVIEQERALEYYSEIFSDKIESGMTESQVIASFGNPSDIAYKILSEYRFEPGQTLNDVPVYSPVKDRESDAPKKQAESAYSSASYSQSIGGEGNGFNYRAEDTAAKADKPDSGFKYTEQDSAENYGGAPYPNYNAGKAKKSERKGNRGVLGTIAFVALAVLFGGAAIGVAAGLWGAFAGLAAVGVGFSVSGIITVFMSFAVVTGSATVAGAGGGLVIAGLGIIVLVLLKKIAQLFAKITKLVFSLLYGWYFR